MELFYCRDLTPVANAAHSVTHLHHMLEENKPEPSPYIVGLCDVTCIDNLQHKTTALSSKFLSAFNQVWDYIIFLWCLRKLLMNRLCML